MKQTGALIAKVVTLALMRHIQKADGSISGHLALMCAHLKALPCIEFVFPSTTDTNVAICFSFHGSFLDIGSTPCGPLSNADVPAHPLSSDI